MALRLRYAAALGLAAVAIAAVAAAGLGGSATGAASAVAASPLGAEARCEAYGGLPSGWGADPRAGMVPIPAGSFHFGSTQGYPDERPASAEPVRLPAFWMDRTEVTIAQFAAFVQATGYVTEAERQGGAVVFHQPSEQELGTRPYACWRARDLPTEQEWEYAGKAGREGPELDTAPRDTAGKPTANYWQGSFPAFDAKEDGHAGLAPVGCYTANGFGLHDMIGNVWEWTKDGYSGPHQPHMNGDTAVAAAQTAPRGHQPNRTMVIKGGSFLCSPDFCVRYRASARESQEADLATAHIGFRTVLREGA